MSIATVVSIQSLSMKFFLVEVQHHQISSVDTYLMYGTKHLQMETNKHHCFKRIRLWESTADLFIKYVAGYPVSQFLEYAEL